MDTTLALPPKNIGPVAYVPEQIRVQDTKVAPVRALDRSTTLPPEKTFVAQVITARLSGTAFPEKPGEIAPPERTLRPYSVPMLPYDKDEPEVAAPDQKTTKAAETIEEQTPEQAQQAAPTETAIVNQAPTTSTVPGTPDAPAQDSLTA